MARSFDTSLGTINILFNAAPGPDNQDSGRYEPKLEGDLKRDTLY